MAKRVNKKIQEATHAVLSRSDKVDAKKDIMLDALKATLGIVSRACDIAKVSRDTHYRWLKEDAEYNTAVEALNERSLDFAESQLFALMGGAKRQLVTNAGAVVEVKDAPNASAIIFYLKTKGKARGYIEKMEVDHGLQPNITQLAFAIKAREE
jgi:hypothetical protein